ncbi:hypothetical protein ACOSQ2_021662 [Xanthoceras sorbifolium]
MGKTVITFDLNNCTGYGIQDFAALRAIIWDMVFQILLLGEPKAREDTCGNTCCLHRCAIFHLVFCLLPVIFVSLEKLCRQLRITRRNGQTVITSDRINCSGFREEDTTRTHKGVSVRDKSLNQPHLISFTFAVFIYFSILFTFLTSL